VTAPGLVPTAEDLASLVLIGPFDDVLDYWTTANGCVFWQPARDRRCGRDATGYLCWTHEAVARRRWNKTHPQEITA
jgi:hypothetical protein